MRIRLKKIPVMILLLIMVMMISAGEASAHSKKNTDMKTARIGDDTYYLVKTEKQLRLIGSEKYKMSYHYMLDANIKLKKEWIAIGDDENPFTGTFDGNGYTISNLKITDKKAKYLGLFGYAEGASIYNVTLKNVKLSASKGKSVGAIVAICYDGKVFDNKVIK
jgi:hypothetical protein